MSQQNQRIRECIKSVQIGARAHGEVSHHAMAIAFGVLGDRQPG